MQLHPPNYFFLVAKKRWLPEGKNNTSPKSSSPPHRKKYSGSLLNPPTQNLF